MSVTTVDSVLLLLFLILLTLFFFYTSSQRLFCDARIYPIRVLQGLTLKDNITFQKKRKREKDEDASNYVREKRSLEFHLHQQSIPNVFSVAIPFPQPARRTPSTYLKRCLEGSSGLRICERQQTLRVARLALTRQPLPGGLDAGELRAFAFSIT